jgi:hypothetical protein
MKRSFFVMMMLFSLWGSEEMMGEERVLDDFNAAEGRAAGREWQGFTDRVMGGRSEMRSGIREEEGLRFLRMEGNVSLENNGGFIQVRLPLSEDGGFDGTGYRGLYLRYRTGAEGRYYLHLRTAFNRFPWAHYAAPIPSSGQWVDE